MSRDIHNFLASLFHPIGNVIEKIRLRLSTSFLMGMIRVAYRAIKAFFPFPVKGLDGGQHDSLFRGKLPCDYCKEGTYQRFFGQPICSEECHRLLYPSPQPKVEGLTTTSNTHNQEPPTTEYDYHTVTNDNQ